jgi:serine/threonine protein kinase
MGAVYQAVQEVLERTVAIKLLPAELSSDADFVARFRREARTLAKLPHPGIVSIYELGQTTEGHLFFVMEFVDGSDLAQMIRASALEPGQVLELTAQICEALQHAHRQGVIHRDIKPANILVTKEGRAKLADFGLARPVDAGDGSARASSIVRGTPDYMAPEQRTGQGDHRSDIYAVGALLYEMLTGRRPKGIFDPPSAKVAVDARIDQVVIKALQQEPERRYQQISEMKTDVELLRTPSAEAPPAAGSKLPPTTTVPPDARKTRRRERVLLFASGATVSFVAVTSFSIWLVITKYSPPKRSAGEPGAAPSLQESGPASPQPRPAVSPVPTPPPAVAAEAARAASPQPAPPPKTAETLTLSNDDLLGVVDRTGKPMDAEQIPEELRTRVQRIAFGGRSNAVGLVLAHVKLPDDEPDPYFEASFVGEASSSAGNYLPSRDKANLGYICIRLDRKDVPCQLEVQKTNFRKVTVPIPDVDPAGKLIWLGELSPEFAPRGIVNATKEQPFVNSLGMKFVPVSGTQTLMCIHETRKADYAVYAAANPDVNGQWKNVACDGVPVSDRDDHPVVKVSWGDAKAFCAWLSVKERRSYRLPSDREWSFAVGIGEAEPADGTPASLNGMLQDVYPWGEVWPPPNGAGNFADSSAAEKFPTHGIIPGYNDGYATTAPVMSFQPNKLGIYDLSGNALEWCEDWYDATHAFRVLRGGGWLGYGSLWLFSSCRYHFIPPERRHVEVGFRCIIESLPPGNSGEIGSSPVSAP